MKLKIFDYLELESDLKELIFFYIMYFNLLLVYFY
jgi:hypothetical protein